MSKPHKFPDRTSKLTHGEVRECQFLDGTTRRIEVHPMDWEALFVVSRIVVVAPENRAPVTAGPVFPFV
jgi:hypothetical protein